MVATSAGVQGVGFGLQRPGLRVQVVQERLPLSDASRFRSQGSFGFRVLSFGFRVPGSMFRVLGLGFGFQVSGFGPRDSGVGFQFSGFGPQVLGFSGFGLRGYRTKGLNSSDPAVGKTDCSGVKS